MISKDTAERIAEACSDLEKCKRAISLFEYGQYSSCFVNIAKDENDEGENISIDSEVVKEALEKQLKCLEHEYDYLNSLAKDELKA